MARNIFSTLGIIGLLAVLVAGMQDDSTEQELTRLRRAVADIGLRVSRLEHASGAPSGPADASLANASAENIPRSMVVGGINQGPPRPVDQDEIDDLRSDADSLQDTVNFHLDNEQRVAGGTTYVGGYYSAGHYGYDHSNLGRERAEVAQREMANRYATEASIKRQKAQRLENAANEPVQVIHGHDGNVVFTLRSKHSLALDLEGINIGDTVTWAGTRVSADDTSETWEISSIRKVD